ncbi:MULTISPECIES: hypothetical protein [unclassified Novosphingobium]|uniref:hypothetical protein n=1 Tax=unclassified Novosphingobium TaxID=2644732 RepID=UPI000D327689|nr:MULTISPECIES: hypothetical protein [unclassified Novosphingobium]PTR05737.1 hypothetical protein C8K11_1264 [Novosphingobium sp. GV055]PUA94339.1 hypothetical protein C8K12_1264 [Novosphingobium sp. GV061]PUB12487.1 hypothetical protein C8K14_1264 [Novosphingobium sp. GV079]PUB37279.1 hypothetical protein C8K10_1264 [Novosphingobium sp. GV027]
MLEGFGLYPVCLQIDLDSYDGDWRHVARFRNSSGWLLVAEAEIWVGDKHKATMPLIVGCDEWEEPIPSFIAANLLRCASSLPQLCDEFPPAELELLIERERSEVRKRWLRQSNNAIARIHEAGEHAIRELEDGVDAQMLASNRLIADLGRRRRMLPLDHPGRTAFAAAIADQEDWQTGMISWLADRRQELRAHFDAQERQASQGLHPRLEVELLYVVNWHHAELPAYEVREVWSDAIRATRPWPPFGHAKLDLADNQLAVLAAISGRGYRSGSMPVPPPPATQPLLPANRLTVDWATLRNKLGVVAAQEPEPDPASSVLRVKRDLDRERFGPSQDASVGEGALPPDYKERVARVLNLEALLAQHSPWTDPWFEVNELLQQARRALEVAEGE